MNTDRAARCCPAVLLLVLSPQGLALETGGWGGLLVPWPTVRAIDTRSFEGFALRLRGRQRIAFDDVTMIRLPSGFLDSERAAGRFVPKGPTVNWVVQPDAEVRGPVEARWQAFRGSEAPDPAPLPPLCLGGFRPKQPPVFQAGTAVGCSGS